MSDEINNLIANVKIISDEVRETFGNLSVEQLNWKPNEKEWSVGQCFDHLITTNDLYIDKIQPVADGTHRNNWFSMIPFSTDIVGRLLKKAVSPDSARKIKTFKMFEASTSDISESIIEDFYKNQEQIVSLMEAAKTLDTRKIKIPEPISPLVNIRLFDAFEVMIIHEKRHFNQAQRILKLEGFPK